MKRRNVTALAGSLIVVLMATTFAYAGLSADAAYEKQETVSGNLMTAAVGNEGDAANLTDTHFAGIAAYIGNFDGNDTENSVLKTGFGKGTAAGIAQAVEEQADQSVAEAEQRQKEKEAEWEGRAIASNVQEYVYVRKEASADSEAVGKLQRGAAGDVIEKGENWTLLSSGEVEGYVSNDYLAFGSEALEVAEAVCDYVAVAEGDMLSIREQPDEDAQILATAYTGERFDVVEEGSDWVKVVSAQCVGYMSKAVVNVKLDVGFATPIEPEPEEESEVQSGAADADTGASDSGESDSGKEQSSAGEAASGQEPKQEEPAAQEAADSTVSSGATSHSATFKVTAYCSCAKCCGSYANGYTASGTRVTAGRTIAVDKNVIPLGTTVYIDGVPYVAEDTGVHGKTIDLYMDSHSAALQWGVKYCTVTW